MTLGVKCAQYLFLGAQKFQHCSPKSFASHRCHGIEPLPDQHRVDPGIAQDPISQQILAITHTSSSAFLELVPHAP